METGLLATKLRIPPQPHHLVHRARLLDALEQGIQRSRLALISAPAGYGKTTTLAAWAHDSRLPVVWLSVDTEDNDPDRFLRYLLAGWEQVQPEIRESPLGLLLGAMTPDRKAVLAAFVNAAVHTPSRLVFVLDDYHLIKDPAIHQALTFLLDHLPPTLHIVLACRAEPPLPLARLRARNELLELHAGDLAFLPHETTDLLNECMGLDLAQHTVMELQTQLEGWIAGLQLVALSHQHHTAPDMPDTPTVSGRQRFIADYLTEDVLIHLPEATCRFLLQTSILDRLCGSLCDAVTMGRDGQSMLDRLERDNLFLAALDDGREWFRYHHLFADFLQSELHRRYPDDVTALHQRAARWYLVRDLPEQAFRHAVSGKDLELVSHLFEHYVLARLTGGDTRAVTRWLDSLPREWQSAHPIFGFARACVQIFVGHIEAGMRSLDEVEQRMLLQAEEAEDMRRQRAMVKALRCIIACYQNDLARAEAYADLALRDLPEDEIEMRNGTYGALGDTYRRQGRWEEAKACYLKTLDFTHAHTFHGLSVISYGALADLDLRQGHLRGAASYWKRALATIARPETWGILPLSLIGWVFIRIGEIFYEWNELGEATEYLPQGLERAELSGDVQGMIAGYLLAGRLKLTAGDMIAAGDYLERARSLVENAAFPDWAGRFGLLHLEFLLAQRKIGAAVAWAREMMGSDALEGGANSEVAQLAMSRALIVAGDNTSLTQALSLLDSVLPAAEEEGRAGVTIAALALRALARWRRGESASAMTALERALRLAEPEGYTRLFADMGLPMGRLLQEAYSRQVLPEYVAKLLAAFGGSIAIPASTTRALPEPLSQRELEVLRMIAAGLTNREIAETLVISPETVKKHTGSIYAKLGVGNRTEAASRARELDLLGLPRP